MKAPQAEQVVEPLPPDYEVVLRPGGAWMRVDWAAIYHYRDLLWLLVRRDFVSRYKQTLLGPAWFVLNPLITTLVFMVVFGEVIGVPTDELPPSLFYLGGLVGWGFFANVLGGTGNVLRGNLHLFSKVYFPRLVVPLSIAISQVFTLVLQLATFAAVYAVVVMRNPEVTAGPGWGLALLPLLLVQAGLLGVGVGLLLSAWSVRYRDLQQVAGFIVNLWMYATPVVYPLSKIPEAWRWVAWANPMTTVVEGVRFALLGRGTLDVAGTCVSIAVTLALALLGTWQFQRSARDFVDYA